jgi:hypothetical protein
MPTIIEIPGRGEVEFPDSMSDVDIQAAVSRLAGQQSATPPPAAATAGMPEMSTAADTIPPFLRGVEVMGAPLIPPMGAIPGVLSKIGGGVGKAMGALSRAASKPSVGALAGAAEEGYRTGGDPRSMAVGALAGAGGGSWLGTLLGKGGAPNVAKGMSQAGQAAKGATGGTAPLLDALMRGDSFDDLAALAKRPGTKTVTRPADALALEVLKRDIDWRITDAVPIDAMQRAQSRGGSIIEAGESIPGLGERMAQALKQGDQPLADKLARAIRQRMHITEKVQGR